MTWDFQQCGICDQQSLRSACAYCLSLHLSKCHIVGNHMSRLICFCLEIRKKSLIMHSYGNYHVLPCTVKPCKTATLKRQKLFFKTNYPLMHVKSIAECSKGTFIKLPYDIKIFVLSIFVRLFYTGFTVHSNCTINQTLGLLSICATFQNTKHTKSYLILKIMLI